MKEASSSRSRQGSIRPLLVGAFFLALAAAIIIPLWASRSSMMQGTAPDTAARLTTAQPGTQMKVVCEITARPSPRLLEGIVLEASGNQRYRRTGQSVRIWVGSQQEIIMGGQRDLHKRAVIQVQGRLDQQKVIHTDQVVILTSYVAIE